MSEQYRISVVFEGRDQISNVARNIAGKMDDVSKASSKFAGALADVGKIAGGVVAGLVGFNILGEVRRFAEDATRAFMAFEQASVKLAALAREAGQDVNLLAGAFRMVASAAAREFAVSGQEAISALESLVKAGLSGRDAVQALGQVIMLAKTEGADFATAANAVVQVMAQFGLTGAEAARAVDALTNASRLGIGSAVDFANGLANVGATARAMGMSLEDATSWLVVLERRFGNAQEAGTHLNRFLLELYEIAGKLGVPIRDVEGNLRAVNDIILDVIATVKQSGLSFADLQDKLKGVDMRALKTLFTIAQMTENFDELRDAVRRGGSAMEAFAATMETTAGRFQRMQSEVDRLHRNIGEKFGQIGTMLGSVFLPVVNAAVTAWTGIISWATGNIAGQIQSQIEAWLMLGKVTKEEAADIIVANVEMGRISVQEGLKIAEMLGLTSDKLIEMAGLAQQAGVEVPESFRNIATAANQTADAIKAMSDAVKGLRSSFDLLSGAISVATNFYDVTLAVSKALQGDAELTQEAAESRNRLAATQQVVNFLMQNFGLIQQALQLQMMGATDASNMLLNVFEGLTTALDDGIVTQEEFVNVLRTLGVDSQNVAGSLYNVLRTSLEAVKATIQGNIETAQNFIATLNQMNGMTVHTYHIHHQITVTEGGGGGGGEIVHQTGGRFFEYQRGTAFVPFTGPAILHRGEMVIPRELADLIRGGGLGPRGVNVQVYVDASKVSDPEEVARMVSRELVRRLRAM
jgi:TP901 family phage tail tape measure protein